MTTAAKTTDTDFFDLTQVSAFMLFAGKVKSTVASRIPAVVHVDGTSRIQTVSKTDSPRYWKLINAFKKATGVPLLVNTSFNLKDEPIVCSPADAVGSFMRSKIDYLAIGHFLAWRQPQENPFTNQQGKDALLGSHLRT